MMHISFKHNRKTTERISFIVGRTQDNPIRKGRYASTCFGVFNLPNSDNRRAIPFGFKGFDTADCAYLFLA